MSEKRDFLRVPKEAPVEVSELTYPLPERDECTVLGKNLSCGGICILATSEYKPGTVLSLKISLAGFHGFKKKTMVIDTSSIAPLTVIGEVVWCMMGTDETGFEVGVKFLDIYEDDTIALECYLSDYHEYGEGI